MLICKGGITRNIDANNLQVYKNRGYEPVPEAADLEVPEATAVPEPEPSAKMGKITPPKKAAE